ncbi:MAG: UTP--glucose-1-phosphate uridylyltransferase [Myxococcota bacterium]|jgi:UTP--glucose-1-phosphate uridylyltransferase|nr:UTP--glucose-1-phosphate uridylyltransferase [Myxococcota bacterium]
MLSDAQHERFCQKMRNEGLPEIAIAAFSRALRFVAEGGATTIAETAIEPVDRLEHLDGLDRYEAAGREAVQHSVVIKLNGGLGTSMGLSKAKSLLEVRKGVTFLDLIARQVLAQRDAWGGELSLLLMNSFRTRDDSLAALAKYEGLARDLPLDFVQHKVPRIDIEAEAWAPVEWPSDADLEWCPPGHGDLYIALASSGMLDALRARGIRYAFVSNADNLGAVLDPRILGYMASQELPFLMEVAERTEADKKGGHLARRDGQLLLREVAQCPKEDLEAFQDVGRHRFFNTNNLWVDLDALAHALEASSEGLALPVISNEKRVSSVDDSSPRCLQLETAMGSAIECFEGAEAIVVPRVRFAPVKTTNDLLLLWSDAYDMTDDARMVPAQTADPIDRVIDLDSRYYGKIDDLSKRFASGAPSLIKCRRFSVAGDHEFGPDVSIEGDVQLVNEADEPVEVAAGSVLSGTSSD